MTNLYICIRLIAISNKNIRITLPLSVQKLRKLQIATHLYVRINMTQFYTIVIIDERENEKSFTIRKGYSRIAIDTITYVICAYMRRFVMLSSFSNLLGNFV